MFLHMVDHKKDWETACVLGEGEEETSGAGGKIATSEEVTKLYSAVAIFSFHFPLFSYASSSTPHPCE